MIASSGDSASVGSAAFEADQRAGFIDMTRAIRSPGSTLKPLIYGMGFDQGLIHPETLIEDRPSDFNGYRPQFYFRTTDVTGNLSLPEGVEMVMPGDNVTITGELIMPIAMTEELRFAIREGGRTVGAGVVTKVIK